MSPIDARIPLGVQPVQFHDPMQTLAQIANLQSMQTYRQAQIENLANQQEERAARIEERRTKMAGEQALNAAMKTALNPDGTFNRQVLQGGVVNAGYGHLWPGIEKGLNEAEEKSVGIAKTRGEVDVARRNAFGSAAASGLELPDELLVPWLETNLAKLVKDGNVPQADAAKFLDDVPDDIEEVRTMLQLAVRNSPEQQRILNERARPVVVGKTVYDPTGTKVLQQAPDDYNFQSKNVTVTYPDGKTVTGIFGFDPDHNVYAELGSKTPLPAGSKVVDAPSAVDPTLAATRDITAALARQQLNQGGITGGQRATIINSSRDDWRKVINPVLERRGAVAKIDSGLSALQAGNRNAATQIIITAFNKLQDELSVVREGEYLRSEQGQSLFTRIGGALNKLALGGAKLTDAELTELATEAKNVAKSVNDVQEVELRNTRQGIEETLTDYNIPHSRVFGTSTIGQRSAAGATDATAGTAGNYKVDDVVTVNGRRVKITKVNPDGTFKGVPVP